MPAKKSAQKTTKKAPKKQKSFEETLWDTANTALRESAELESEGIPQSVPQGQDNLRGTVESLDQSAATKTTRQSCPEGECRGANQNTFQHHHLSFSLLTFFVSTNTKGDCPARNATKMPKAKPQSLTRQREIRQKLVENELVDTAPRDSAFPQSKAIPQVASEAKDNMIASVPLNSLPLAA